MGAAHMDEKSTDPPGTKPAPYVESTKPPPKPSTPPGPPNPPRLPDRRPVG